MMQHAVFIFLLTFTTGKCIREGKSSPEGAWAPVGYDEAGQWFCKCLGGQWSECYRQGSSPMSNLMDTSSPMSNVMDTSQATPAGSRSISNAEFIDQFTDDQFVFDFNKRAETPGPAGMIQPATVDNWDVLRGHGLSATRFTVQGCGINLPHVHPRATEMTFVINADRLRVAFVGENNHGVKTNDISTGMLTFFPQGLMHYQQNLACTPAHYISILNSEDPGVQTITTQFFKFDDMAVAASFGTESRSSLPLSLPKGPASGLLECRKRCGITGPLEDMMSFSGGGSM